MIQNKDRKSVFFNRVSKNVLRHIEMVEILNKNIHS